MGEVKGWGPESADPGGDLGGDGGEETAVRQEPPAPDIGGHLDDG